MIDRAQAVPSVYAEPSASAAPSASAQNLPPKNAGVVVDASLGVPSIQGNGFNLSGRASLGYQDDHWGTIANGSINAYASVSTSAVVTTRKTTAAANVWGNYVFADGDGWIQLRGDFGYAGYASTRVPFDGSNNVYGERSIMGRFNGLAVGHYQDKGKRFGADGWVGLGAQLEAYTVTQGQLLALPSSVQIKGTFTADVIAKLRAFAYCGDFGLARLESSFQYFQITKATATLDPASGLTGNGALNVANQVDSESVLYFDVLAAQFWGFIPMLHANLDIYANWATAVPTTLSLVPSGGIGLRRSVF